MNLPRHAASRRVGAVTSGMALQRRALGVAAARRALGVAAGGCNTTGSTARRASRRAARRNAWRSILRHAARRQPASLKLANAPACTPACILACWLVRFCLSRAAACIDRLTAGVGGAGNNDCRNNGLASIAISSWPGAAAPGARVSGDAAALSRGRCAAAGAVVSAKQP